jgi:hypothetical protein
VVHTEQQTYPTTAADESGLGKCVDWAVFIIMENGWILAVEAFREGFPGVTDPEQNVGGEFDFDQILQFSVLFDV